MGILDNIPFVSEIKLTAVGIAAALISGSLVASYMNLVTIPAAEKDAAQIAQSEMLEKFNEISNELADDAEKFRARRLACGAAGGVFDFATGNCREG
jgi:predicted xylose isomerase-like sugar epimerase